jgi:hypothetical protein
MTICTTMSPAREYDNNSLRFKTLSVLSCLTALT